MSQTISIIIPAYNAEGFIHRAIKSAALQTLRPLEIIVIDDCSNDTTAHVVQSIAGEYEDGFIKFLKMPVNSGPSAARNAGIRATKGEWIAILDADDAYLPARLETMMREGAALNADIIADNMCYWNPHTDARSTPLFRAEAKTIDLDMYLKHSFPCEGEADYGLLKPVYSRKFVLNHNIFYAEETRHGEDFLFILEALFKNARYVFVPALGYLYSSRDTGLSRTEINYRKVVADTEKLLSHPRILNNSNAQKALKKRMESASKLADEQDISSWFKNGDFSKIFDYAFKSPENFMIFSKKSTLFAMKKIGVRI